jgi:hypothetical protein
LTEYQLFVGAVVLLQSLGRFIEVAILLLYDQDMACWIGYYEIDFTECRKFGVGFTPVDAVVHREIIWQFIAKNFQGRQLLVIFITRPRDRYVRRVNGRHQGVLPIVLQIVVMCMIFGAAGLSTVCFLALIRQTEHFSEIHKANS